MTTITITADRDRLRDQLTARARDAGRELCGRCAGSATQPCQRCANQRARIAELAAGGKAHAHIAASVGLPVWRVERILDENDMAHQRGPGAEILTDELAFLLGDPELAAAAVDALTLRYTKARAATIAAGLKPVGWTTRSARNVLAGTHIPNRPVREAYVAAAAGDETITAQGMARTLGLAGDTHFSRLLGLRPESVSTKRRRGVEHAYGGGYRTAMGTSYAAHIVAHLGLSRDAIPGL